MNWWYVAISDWMIVNEGKARSLQECAVELGRNYQTIKMIAASDMFKAFHNGRRKEMMTDLQDGINQKISKVAVAGLDLLLEKLDKKRDALTADQLVGITESALDKLGYGQKAVGASPSANVTVNVVTPISAEELQQARAKIAALEHAKVIEGKVVEPAPPVALDDGSRRPPSITTKPDPEPVLTKEEKDAARLASLL